MAGMGEAALGMSARRWLVAGGVALVGVAAAATAVAGGFGSAADRQPTSSGQATASPSATACPARAPPRKPTTAPSTSEPAEPTARPTRSAAEPTPPPAQTTYVVQEGDTLNAIAVRFGTTVEAIRQANGLPRRRDQHRAGAGHPLTCGAAQNGGWQVRQKVVASSPPIWRSGRPQRGHGSPPRRWTFRNSRCCTSMFGGTSSRTRSVASASTLRIAR